MERYRDIIDIPRPKSTHPKMSLANRANQFVPMDALRGFSLAILTKQVEQEYVPRITLSNDAQELLDRKMHWLRPGVQATVTFFRLEKRIGDLEVGTYAKASGLVELLDPESGLLILGEQCIPIEDVIEIESKAFDSVPTEVESYAG